MKWLAKIEQFDLRRADGEPGRSPIDDWLGTVGQPWLLTLLIMQTVGWWIYEQQAPIDQFSLPVYALSVVASGAFWYLLNLGRDSLAKLGRLLLAVSFAPLIGLILVGNYQIYVEFGEFFSASMMQYAGRGGTSTFARYIVEYLYYPLNAIFFASIPCLAAIWYFGSELQAEGTSERARSAVVSFGIFATSLSATAAVASGHHLAPDTAFLSASIRSFYSPPPRDLHTPERAPVPDSPDPTPDPPNVVLVINESLGIQEIDFSGRRTDQMPYIQQWIRREPTNFVSLQYAYANSTSTDLSVPSLLTGVGPYESTETLHQMPLAWDWARAGGLDPFYISAQNYSSTSFHEFFFSGDPMPVRTPTTIEGLGEGDFAVDELMIAEHFAQQLAQVPDDRPFFAVYNSDCMHKPFQQTSSRLDEQPDKETAYRNAMVILDEALGRIVESVRREGRLDETIFIFTSDHGEYPTRLHDVPRILSLYEEFIRVPMLVRVPSSWASSHPAKMRALRDNRRRNVANVDVVPSIVDLLGLDQRADARRLRDRLDGYSLFSPVPADRTIIALNNNPVRHWEHKGFGVFWRDWRFVFTTVQGPRLFDLADDPRQQQDLWQQAPPTARRRVHQTIEGNPFLSRIWREYNRPKPRLFAIQP